MLKFAYPYRDKINQILPELMLDPKYKYHTLDPYMKLEREFKKDTWAELAFVSAHKDDHNQIYGLLQAYLSRENNKVTQILIINFGEINATFSRDMARFFDDLFCKYNFRKIEFSALVKNPATPMYKKWVTRYGGRIVGVQHEAYRLQDGNYYNVRMYEMFRKDYLIAKEPSKKVAKKNFQIRDAEIVELYEQEWTLRAIGDRFHITHTRVAQILKEQGIERRVFAKKRIPAKQKKRTFKRDDKGFLIMAEKQAKKKGGEL